LEILVRVPVGVEDDDGVGGLKVEAEASGSRRQQEDEVLRVRTVEDPQLQNKWIKYVAGGCSCGAKKE
jgi:hypothetical protein